MARKYLTLGILALVITGIVFISGCVQEGKQETYQQMQTKETEQPQTEINLENNGLKVKISPVEGKKVSGAITVTLENVPEKATKILVSMVPQGLKETFTIALTL